MAPRTIKIEIPGAPPKGMPAQRKRTGIAGNGKRVFFHGKAYLSAKRHVEAGLMPHKLPRPLEGPLKLHVSFQFPWRAKEPQKRRKQGLVPHDVRPDCDNLVKMVQDCLGSMGFFKDDAQVFQLCVTKYWGDRPGISISLDFHDGAPMTGGEMGETE